MYEQNKLKVRVGVARNNLLFFIILTALNIIILLIGGKLYLPYSSFICTYSVALARGLAGVDEGDLGSNIDLTSAVKTATIISVIFVAVVVGLLLLCYFKSKSKSGWLIGALVYILVDLLALLFVMAMSDGFAEFLLDLVMHALILFYMIRGVSAYSKLKTAVPFARPDIEVDDFSEPDFGSDEEAERYSDNTSASAEELELYDNSGRQLIAKRYKNLNIVVVRCDEKLLLVVNGFICDAEELDGDEPSCELAATVNGVSISLDYSRADDTIKLFINGEPI